MIPVTKPFLPPKKALDKQLEGVFRRNWLTNNGPLLNEFELNLKSYLDLDHLLVVGNGTIALQLAIKALGLRGEVITTPFSYVATTSALVWEGCTPVFADIDPNTFNIDPKSIETKISPSTSAILATHCFGNACDIDSIQTIANKHGLKVIYDAAHCFGTKFRGRSIFEFGDISTLSLHATKPMHSVEGGAIITKDPNLLKRMAFMRNFGHDGPEKYNGVGINGKNSEFHAAMGLCVLEHANEILEKRKELSENYDRKLKDLDAKRQSITEKCKYNHAYFPIVFKDDKMAIKVQNKLSNQEIFARRYFYPLLSSLDYVSNDSDLPVAKSISSSILCLPLFHDLRSEEQDLITRKILRISNYG